MKGASYAETIDRIMIATKSKTETDLARALKVKPQSVSQAKKKGSIPAQWFVCIALEYGVSLDWLVSGREAVHGATNTACPRCVELYEKLVLVQERENAVLKENGELKAASMALQAENAELKSQLSLSAAVDGESSHTSAA
jgi:hypothetical protein